MARPGIAFGSGTSKSAVRIGELVRVQLQVVQRLDIVAARGTQKPRPERAHVIRGRKC